MQQGETPESRSTAFHYQHTTPGAPSVVSGAQAAAAGAGAGRIGGGGADGGGPPAAAPAGGAGGGINPGGGDGQQQQQQQQQQAANQPLSPAFASARSRVHAVQAAGPLLAAGMGAVGAASHHSTQGTALWIKTGGGSNSFTTIKSQGGGVETAKMCMVQGNLQQEYSVFGQLVTAALEQLISEGQLRGRATVYLALHLLRCYQASTLPAELLQRWVEAGLVARSGGGGLVPVLEELHRYPLVIKVDLIRGGWQLQSANAASKRYNNNWLRRGLYQLGLRLREDGDADGEVVHSAFGCQYVFTPFGAALWHDTLQAAFSSLEVARGLEVQWTTQAPTAEQLLGPQAPADWQLSRVDMGAQVQQGA